MSGSSGPTIITSTPPPVDTRVDAETQARLLEHWRQFGPNAGAIVPPTIWDGGATQWDEGATTWPS